MEREVSLSEVSYAYMDNNIKEEKLNRRRKEEKREFLGLTGISGDPAGG